MVREHEYSVVWMVSGGSLIPFHGCSYSTADW